MSTYEGTAIKDKAVIRKSPATGMIIGTLKAGTSITGDRVADASDGGKWLHLSKPMDGWALLSDLRYTISKADSPSLLSVNASIAPGTQYEVVSADNEMSLRIDHDAASEKIESVLNNTVMLADSLWTAPADAENIKAGDMWAHVISVDGVAKDGWVAVKHLGVVYCTYRDKALRVPTHTLTESQLAGIVMVRRWGDPELFALDGMSTASIKVGNFQEVPLFHTYKDAPTKGEFGAITCFQELGPAEMAYLKKIQPDDASKYGFGLKQKMNWLVGGPEIRPPERIYWSEEVTWDNPALKRFRFGTLVFGGQKVLVETDAAGHKVEYSFFGKYRNKEKKEWIPCYKIVGMRRAEVGRPIAELLQEGKMQICTSANRSGHGEDQYTETLKGVVYHPVWSPLDYPSNYGNTLYLPTAFCLDK